MSVDVQDLDPGDDVMGAVALPSDGRCIGTLDVDSDEADVYSCTIPAHSRIRVTLVSSGTSLVADAYLVGGTVSTLAGAVALAGTSSDDSAETFIYDNTSGADAPAYIAVVAESGAGAYSLTCDTYDVPSGTDDDISGATNINAAVTGTLDYETDTDDLYAVNVGAGQRLTASLHAEDGLDAAMYIFRPGSSSINTSLPEWGSSSSSDVVCDASTGGVGIYYIDARALHGTGAYTLNVTVTAVPATAWDDVAQAVSIEANGVYDGALNNLADCNDVYAVNLTAGQRLTVNMQSASGSDFDLYAYSPGTTIGGATPISWSNMSDQSDCLVLDAPVSGRYYVEVRQFSGDGTYHLAWSTSATPHVTPAVRIQGHDRYATAIALSRSTFTHAETVVLATGASFPDALSASSLAGVYDSPLLLTQANSLSSGLLDELSRLGTTKVVIVGGTNAVATPVAEALAQAGYGVERISGSDRYATASAIATRVVTLRGADWDGSIFVVRGDQFADALAVSPLAYSRRMPVLLAATDHLPVTTLSAISDHDVNQIVVAGGTSAIDKNAYAALKAAVGSDGDVERAQGSNRYATARAVADYTVKMYWADSSFVGVATGLDFPDALGGGAVAGARGGVLLLTEKNVLSSSTSAFLNANQDQLRNVDLFGGSSVVGPAVLDSLSGYTSY